MKKREKYFSLLSYILIFVWLLIPWIQLGANRYSLPGFALHFKSAGIRKLILESGAQIDDPVLAQVELTIILIAFLAYFITGLGHFISVLAGKNWGLNLGSFILSVVLIYIIQGSISWIMICQGSVFSSVYPAFLLLFTVAEFTVRKMMAIWDNAKRESKEYLSAEKRFKAERKRRLAFPGRYSKLLPKLILKNFCRGLSNYIVLLACNSIVFTAVLAALGLNQLTAKNAGNFWETGSLSGASETLFSGMAGLGAAGVLMLVLLLLYYLRKRLPEYGVFKTLGIRRKTLYLCVGAELGAGALVSLGIGAIAGSLLLYAISGQTAAPMTLLKALAAMLALYLITFFVTHDLFVSFRMGSSTDLQMIKENMPKKYHKLMMCAGIALCLFAAFLYSQTINFESFYYIAACFIGIYLILRFGIAGYFRRWEEKKGHLKGLLSCHPFFHKSRSASWYLFGLSILQFCILAVFSVQIFSVKLVPNPEKLYPYDLVCLANKEFPEDEELIRALKEDFHADVKTYPMVRVSGMDGTKRSESSEQKAVGGQQIGIPESVYHELKKAAHPSYQKKELHLDAGGESIYIVHQQDKSAKAQAIDYRTPKDTPALYTGPACEGVNPLFSKDTAYDLRKIAGEETDSLIGIFAQGECENLVVFSDAYFEKAKDMWKTTDCYTGKVIENPAECIEGETTRQGPSLLVLVQADAETLQEISPELEAFKARHKEDENYDARIESVYFKADAMDALQADLKLKTTVARLVVSAFFAACILLIGIKMMTDLSASRKRAKFLRYMGMKKKERVRLIRFEMRVYYILTALLPATLSAVFLAAAFRARLYTWGDITVLLKYLLPFWVCETLGLGAAIWILTRIYTMKTEAVNR